MYSSLQELLRNTFMQHSGHNALWIKGNYFTYGELAGAINQTLPKLPQPGNVISIVTSDCAGTYATILACMLNGNGFVPVSPSYPAARIQSIIEQSESIAIFSEKPIESELHAYIPNILFAQTVEDALLPSSKFAKPQPDDIAAILFTSGSTGIPKGVPMTFRNIEATLDAYRALNCGPFAGDRCLQMFEFTFDMSMLSYLTSFVSGACVYSVVDDKMRFFSAFKLIKEYELTHAVFVPSTLAFMRKYFTGMQFPALKSCMVGGEPFSVQLATEWANCAPNARIFNISGPTETTMACMGYEFQRNTTNKNLNGILAFGKPWKNSNAIVVNENNEILPPMERGELCFAGENVMKGYINNAELNAIVFFTAEIEGNHFTFYRTGDGAYMDSEGDFFTCGRIDHQVKIQGYRVEPGEIEAVTREITGDCLLAAVPFKKSEDFYAIRLCLDLETFDKNNILQFLGTKLANYMLPEDITRVSPMPLNANGKIDRNKLKQMLERGEL